MIQQFCNGKYTQSERHRTENFFNKKVKSKVIATKNIPDNNTNEITENFRFYQGNNNQTNTENPDNLPEKIALRPRNIFEPVREKIPYQIKG